MMVQSFSMPEATIINPTVYENLSGYDLYIWLVSHVFAYKKFEAIFAMLFGAGLVMLSQKAMREHLRSADLQNRRLIFLGLFGILNAYLIWYGDVLLMFSICGLLMFIFRRKRSAVQIRAGIIFLFIGSAISLIIGYSVPLWEPGEFERYQQEIWQPSSEQIAEEIDYYQSAWERQVIFRAPQSFAHQTSQFLYQDFWRFSGLMLIGMAMYRRKVFKAKQSKKTYYKMIGYGLGLGLPLVVIEPMLNFNFEWEFQYGYFFFSQLNYIGSVLIAISYTGIVMLLCKGSTRGFLPKRLSEVGRMSLSNYLIVGIICSFIFYGQGFALFGEVERSIQALFVLSLWAFILAFSAVWLSFFNYGPFEWLWRTLTYGKVQKMVKD